MNRSVDPDINEKCSKCNEKSTNRTTTSPSKRDIHYTNQEGFRELLECIVVC